MLSCLQVIRFMGMVLAVELLCKYCLGSSSIAILLLFNAPAAISFKQ